MARHIAPCTEQSQEDAVFFDDGFSAADPWIVALGQSLLLPRIANAFRLVFPESAELLGQTDLKIGNTTVVHDFDQSIRALLDARDSFERVQALLDAARAAERLRCASHLVEMAAAYNKQVGKTHTDTADAMRCCAQSIRDHLR